MRHHLYLPIVLLAAPLTIAAPPRIVFNSDAQVLMEAPEEGTSEFVRAWLDRQIGGVPFTTFVFLAATPDICTYQSKAGEVYGERFGDEFKEGWAPGIRGLIPEGTDGLRLVADHMHAAGKEVLAAIRMNDTHHRELELKHPLCSRFAVEHPEYVIKQPDGRTNETALDYSYPEVRAHRMAIMKEIVEEYTVDGLELNFVRWAKHFPRDEAPDKAPILTEFVAEIRKMLDAEAKKRNGRRLTLGVRVPESVEACRLAGVDIKIWVERNLVDFVVISTWNNTDPQLRVDEFARFTKPAGVDTIVVMGNMIGAPWTGLPKILDRPVAMSAKQKPNTYLAMLITESEARAAAANYYAWGADSISFWNVGLYYGSENYAAPEQRERIAEWTTAVASKGRVYEGPRTYRYLPMGKGMGAKKPPARNYAFAEEGRSPLGHVNSPVLTFAPDEVGRRLVFPFRMADGRDGERLDGTLTFWVYHLRADDAISVDMNGKPIDAAKIRRSPVGKRRGGLAGARFEIDLSCCPAFRGENVLGLTLETAGERDASPYMEELEIVVR